MITIARDAGIDAAERAVTRIQLDLGDLVESLKKGFHPALHFNAEGVNNSLTRARQLVGAFKALKPSEQMAVSPIDHAILTWRINDLPHPD